ncbi:MAG: phosphoribosylanthranilate isomerase [Pirellulaceae bacterium]
MPHPFSIKICGIANVPDALQAVAMGADAIGLNFYPRSLRSIDFDTASKICEALRELPKPPQIVGVFVNEAAESILAIAERLRLDYVQLHGDEDPELTDGLRPFSIIRAIRLARGNELRSLTEFGRWHKNGVRLFLLDALAESGYGGTGKTVEWKTIPQLRRQLAEYGSPRIILAGGLVPNNVEEAIGQALPDAIDVASGVESLPGKKDHALLKTFIENSKRGFETASRVKHKE